MKKLLCLVAVLCLFAIPAAADPLTVNLETFETLFNIWGEYYQVDPLPEMQQRDEYSCYYAQDYSIIAKLYETGEIQQIMLIYKRPIDFNFIAVAACVTSSMFSENHNDSILDIVFQYRNGVENNAVIFNDHHSMMSLLPNGNHYVLAISENIPGQ